MQETTARRLLVLMITSGLAGGAAAQGPLTEPFPPTLELGALDGTLGFRLDGVEELRLSGTSVAPAGDLNGDGFDDLVVGAFGGWSSYLPGSAFVVFGRDASAGAPFPARLPLESLDGVTGFRLDGISAGSWTGRSVASAGDVNGDGIDDLIIGAPREVTRAAVLATGSAYVVYGRDSATGAAFPARLDLASLDGVTGFRMDGPRRTDSAGTSVAAAGDVNGDGVDDVIIGSPDALIGGSTAAGSAFVVFGRDTKTTGAFPQAFGLDALDGTNGFRVDGFSEFALIGFAVSSAGDFNADGFDDVIIGSLTNRSTFVVFGQDASRAFPAVLSLADLDGVNGIRLNDNDHTGSGFSVAKAGDVNADGIDDVIIGAYRSDAGGLDAAGASFVVFGRDSTAGHAFPLDLELTSLDGANGFRIDGAAAFDRSGSSVASAGDVNGDGIDDLAIGAPGPWEGDARTPGAGFVLFGRNGPAGEAFPATIGLSSLDGDIGFRLNGETVRDEAGTSIASAGDINGDGVGDLIIGAPWASPGGRSDAGSTYVVYGRDLSPCPADVDGDGALTALDFLAFVNLFDAGDPRADFDGDGELTVFDFLAFQTAFDAGCP